MTRHPGVDPVAAKARTRGRSAFAAAVAVASGALALTSSSPAYAQNGAGPTDMGNGANGAQPGAPAAPAGGTTVGSVYGAVAPPPPGQPVGGGNATESSSRPVTGETEDGFDLAPSAGPAGPIVGGRGGPVFFQDGSTEATLVGPPPAVHVVQKGETLWAICDRNLRNPYQWPRIWSYNPQIQNPHWIYPNEQVRLKPGVPLTAGPQVAMPEEGRGAEVMSRSRVAPDTLFLRDMGFVNDDADLNWGSIVGAREDRMYLTDFAEVYVRIGPSHDAKVGQELTIFRPVRPVADGQVIAIQGTLKINDWNPETRIARAQVVESLDAIERGARVGPISRRFQRVAPKRNEAEVTAHVVISTQPHVFYDQNQIVFIDAGAEAGLQVGNRLFVVRHGDAWRTSMVTAQTARRIMGEREDPAAIENTPRLKNEEALPEEVVAELRVVDVQKKSATCLVSQSRREIEPGEIAIARKGY